MLKTRLSTPADLPAQRQLWQLAFGDSGDYMDNFYNNYYQPQLVLVLEEDGVVRAMTAWFDTEFCVPGEGTYRAAYLYAVATHPDCRGRGLARKLLADSDDYFRTIGIPAVTTVPAEPSLHNFFGANGFGECFLLEEKALEPEDIPEGEQETFVPVTPAEYGALREELLKDISHIAYGEAALAYQAGCCALSGGGLFRGDTDYGPVCLCAEGAGDGLFVIKEYLGDATAQRLALSGLPKAVPGSKWLIRGPVSPGDETDKSWKFGMLKWLDGQQKAQWDWANRAYLGLAFD